MTAILHTNKGDITIEFFDKDAPNTVANFKKLTGEGFYNGVKFHRVIKGFMIQSGDPLTKDDSKMAQWGTGGPGYKFADEIGSNNKNNIGTIAMANSGLPGTSGFVGEFMVILSSFQASAWIAFAAATILILGAAYTLWMYKRVIFGEVANEHVAELKDISPREGLILWALAIVVLLFGLWPAPIFEMMQPTLEHLFEHVIQTKAG